MRVIELAVDNHTEGFQFDANHIALDFINTLRRHEGTVVDQLRTFDDLSKWLLKSGLLQQQLDACSNDASDLVETGRIFESALKLRTNLRRAIEQIEAGNYVPTDFVSFLNPLLERHRKSYVLVGQATPMQLEIRYEDNRPTHLVGLLAEQVADLLTKNLMGCLKKCENPQCIRHYLDTSRNQTRRWCSMERCGNRAKAHAYYQRTRRRKTAKLS